MHKATRNIIAPTKIYKDDKLSIVIPAAGMGHRMKSCGPKALLSLRNGTTLIENQLQILWSCYPNAEIFVVVGFEGEKIREKLSRYPVRFICNPTHQTTNVLYSIGLATQAIVSSELLLVYGDLIFNSKAVRNLKGVQSKIVVDGYNWLKDEEVGVAFENKMATNLAYGLQNKWAHIAYFTGNELGLLKEIAVREDTSQWFGYEAINYIISRGGKLEVIKPRTMVLHEIDSIKDLDKFITNK